jgi:hypothetical protein
MRDSKIEPQRMKARSVTVGEAEILGKERDGKQKEQTKAETEALVKKRSQSGPFGAEDAAI